MQQLPIFPKMPKAFRTLYDSIEIGHRAAAAAADKAERIEPGWIDASAERIRDFAVAHRSEAWTIERARAGLSLPAGSDGRSWGHVTKRCVRLGYIEQVPGHMHRLRRAMAAPNPCTAPGDPHDRQSVHSAHLVRVDR